MGCGGHVRTGAEDAVQVLVVHEGRQQDRNVKIDDRPGMSLGAREVIKISEKSLYKQKQKKHTHKKQLAAHISALPLEYSSGT